MRKITDLQQKKTQLDFDGGKRANNRDCQETEHLV